LELDARNSDTALKTRMEAIERRLIDIEKKLFLNPPAA